MTGATQQNGAAAVDDAMGDEAVRHLQALLRIDTTNPPGRETAAAEYVAGVLREAGLEPFLDGPTPERRSLVARVPAASDKKAGGPLLLHAHLDVVPADARRWRHPPFGGEIHDGYVWGRGAVDTKHMAVMSALVMARLAREGRKLSRDVIFAAVADEEAGSDHGARFLVDQHPDRVRAEFALGEVGGATVWLNGKALYPIQVAEKGLVWMTLRAEGTPGHGSLPRDDNAIARLGDAVARLGRTRLPQHLTPEAERYIDALAAAQQFPRNLILKQLKRAPLAPRILRMLPDQGAARALRAVLSNTAVPTVLRAGDKVNVIPGAAEAEVDGRSLPGQTTADLVREVKQVVGEGIDVCVHREMPPLSTPPDSPLYHAIVDAIGAHHPGATCIPYLMPGFTDAKQWARLGARCYGFCPVRFPDDGTRFADLFHGDDERVPVEGLRWGVRVLYDIVTRFAG